MKLVVWGASGHARSVADAIDSARLGSVAAFIDDANPVAGGASFLGAPLHGSAGELERLYDEGVRHAVIAVGDSRVRMRLIARLKALGFTLPVLVHGTAWVARTAAVGEGTVVLARAVIGAAAQVGAGVIVNTGAVLDHDCVAGDGAHLCPGVTVGGHAQIGAGAWIGIGATLKDRVRVGANTTVGAGAVVLDDLPDNVVAYGVPARVARDA
jgi:UDP-N-acetylbacillosamine N-acetyltransferase